jgi:glycerophosphoryl diester phosphodiesterase
MIEPLVIAHRGASGYLPEHTLAAKAMAHAMGADYLEQDVVLSRDNVPVVLHDIHLEYTSDVAQRYPDQVRSDGHYYALDFTLAQIRTLRAHERTADGKSAVYPERFPVGVGEFRIPTLLEEIEFIDGLNKSSGSDTGLYIELKAPNWHLAQGHDLAAAVLAVLQQTGYADRSEQVFLQCFDHSTLKRLRLEFQTPLPLIQLIGENDWGEDTDSDYSRMCTLEGLEEVARYADGIGPWLPQVLQCGGSGQLEPTGLVADAHKLGLKVHPYTLRRDELPQGIEHLDQVHQALFIDAGADGAFSDFPDLTRQFIDNMPR